MAGVPFALLQVNETKNKINGVKKNKKTTKTNQNIILRVENILHIHIKYTHTIRTESQNNTKCAISYNIDLWMDSRRTV